MILGMLIIFIRNTDGKYKNKNLKTAISARDRCLCLFLRTNLRMIVASDPRAVWCPITETAGMLFFFARYGDSSVAAASSLGDICGIWCKVQLLSDHAF